MGFIRKIIFWVFIVAAITGAVWAYYSIKNSKKPKVDALSLLPDSCLVYLNTNNFFELVKKINSQSLVFDKLKAFKEVNTLCNTLQTFDSLIRSNEQIQHELEDNLIHLALYNKNCDWLIAFNIKELGKQATVSELLGKIFKMPKDQSDIRSFNITKNNSCFFTLNSGVALLSNSGSVIEKALNNSSAKFSRSTSYAENKSSLTENNLLCIYIDHNLYSQNKVASHLDLTPHCKKGSSAGAIDIEPSELKVTGYLSVDSTEILSALINQPAQSTKDFTDFLPNTTVSFKAYGFGSYTLVNKKLSVLKGKTNENYWKDVNEAALYNLQTDLEGNIKNHILAFKTSGQNKNYLAVEITDSIKGLEHLQFMSDTAFIEKAYKVYQLKRTSEESLHLFKPLYNKPTHFACYYRSHLLFSESKEDLLILLTDYQNNQLAKNDESFAVYKNQNFTDEFNYLFYTSPALDPQDVNAVFNFTLNDKNSSLESFRHFSYSLINDQKSFKFRLQLLNEPDNSGGKQNNLWTLKLDTTSCCKPFGFVNHITKENEVFVQDDKNMAYLVNAKGKLLWKKPISEKIQSEIFMVDAFKNNKYQLLFNTKNYLHLIDRNGDYVKGYPVRLPAEATSPLCLFDYDLNKEYRLFLACKNNFIYNYTILGVLNDGFKNVKTEKEVRLPIQYVKVGQSDYLITLDAEGKIYTFSRKGEMRIALKNRTIANCSSFYVDAGTNVVTTHIIYVDDKSGAINKISLADKKEIVNLNYESESTRARYTLVDDNREMDLITTHDKNILAYDLNGGLLLDKNTEEELGEPDFYSDEAHTLYYALVKGKKSLLVFKQLKQKTLSIDATSMPLISNLFNDNKKYFIVSNGSWLSCQLIN